MIIGVLVFKPNKNCSHALKGKYYVAIWISRDNMHAKQIGTSFCFIHEKIMNYYVSETQFINLLIISVNVIRNIAMNL